MPLVTVVVVTWNRREYLRGCLDALFRQTYRESIVVVVDNASTDGSAELVATEYPEARLIRNGANLGFAAANNIGIHATETPYVATLNNDAEAEPGWLEALVHAAEADASLGSVASKMVLAPDPQTVDSCGVALDPAGIAWDRWGGYPAGTVDRRTEVFGPCAGAALYRRAMLDDVGLFDEDYFAYLEDVDLAWRARLRGWRCVLEPAAVVRHAHAGTLGDTSALKRFLLARNKVWTIAKCAPAPDLWAWLPVIVAYDVGAAAFGVARQRDWASVRGRLAGLYRLPSALEKRRVIQARRTISISALRAHYAPLASPWDVPRRYRHLTGGGATADGGQRPTASGGRSHARGGEALAIAASLRGPGTRLRRGSAARGSRLDARVLTRRWILRALGFLLPPPRGKLGGAVPPAPPGGRRPWRVVVFRPDHLGDVLLSRPAVEMLRCALPNGEVTVVAGPWGAPSLQGAPVRVVTFPFPGFTRAPKGSPFAPYAALLAFATRLRRERYDAALVLRPDHWWGALAAAAAGIPVRVGQRTAETAPFLTHFVQPIGREPAADGALRLAGALLDAIGAERPPTEARPVRFEPTGDGIAAAGAWISANVPQGRQLVVIHPGAGASLKAWPSHRWASICRALPSGVAVVLSGGFGEEPVVQAIQTMAGRPAPAALSLSWDALSALYRRADVVVGMDSGPLHLAAAVEVPTVRVYGPTDPLLYGPPGEAALHQVVRSALPCAPCGDLVAPPCGYLEHPPCLASASTDEVVAAVLAVLRAGPEIPSPLALEGEGLGGDEL